jgi:hypothetical protein
MYHAPSGESSPKSRQSNNHSIIRKIFFAGKFSDECRLASQGLAIVIIVIHRGERVNPLLRVPFLCEDVSVG